MQSANVYNVKQTVQILNSATKNVTVFRSKKTPQNFNNVFAASTKRRKSIKDTIIHREHTLLFFFFFTFLRFCLTLNNISVNHSGFQISAFFCRSDQTRDMNLLQKMWRRISWCFQDEKKKSKKGMQNTKQLFKLNPSLQWNIKHNSKHNI